MQKNVKLVKILTLSQDINYISCYWVKKCTLKFENSKNMKYNKVWENALVFDKEKQTKAAYCVAMKCGRCFNTPGTFLTTRVCLLSAGRCVQSGDCCESLSLVLPAKSNRHHCWNFKMFADEPTWHSYVAVGLQYYYLVLKQKSPRVGTEWEQGFNNTNPVHFFNSLLMMTKNCD